MVRKLAILCDLSIIIVQYMITADQHVKIHCAKSVQIRSFFWSIFSKYRKIRTEKNSVFGHFSRSEREAKALSESDDNIMYSLHQSSLIS